MMKNNKKSTSKFDIFFSYEYDMESKVLKLRESLSKIIDFSTYVDASYLKHSEKNMNKMNRIIENSKLIVVCITESFIESAKCKTELMIAYSLSKSIVALIVEQIKQSHMNIISYTLVDAKVIRLYEEPDFSFDLLHGNLYEEFVDTIESFLGYEVRKKVKRENEVLESVVENDNITSNGLNKKDLDGDRVIDTRVNFQNECVENGVVIPTVTLLTERVIKARLDQHKDCDSISTIHGFRKFRSSALYQLIYGFNRLIVVESKEKKFVITSSYNKSLIVVDQNGNLIEKRHCGKLIHTPWGICTNGLNEIYIGDNYLQHIVVFDFNFKYLRTIGDGVLGKIYDLAYDNNKNELYAADMYGSVVAIIDGKNGKLKRKIYVSTPTYVKLVKDRLFISNNDYIYIFDKQTYDVIQTIEIPNSEFMSGLHVDENYNIYTTSHVIDEEKNRSKDVYLHVIRSTDKEILKVTNLGLTQVNDFLITNDRMLFLSDTHLDIFEFYDV